MDEKRICVLVEEVDGGYQIETGWPFGKGRAVRTALEGVYDVLADAFGEPLDTDALAEALESDDDDTAS